MLKRLLKSLREYKTPTIFTLILIVSEAVIETFIPFITAELVNRVQAEAQIVEVLRTGMLLIVMAVLSLLCGGGAAFTSSRAASGFAKNLRHDMFSKIQTFDF